MTFDEHNLPALYMLWLPSPFRSLPTIDLHVGYELRTYIETDDIDVRDLLSIEGEIMSHGEWEAYKDRLLPKGLFLIYQSDTNQLVATAGAIHNPNPGRHYFPFGGELGYLIVHPEHRRQGLGKLVSSMVVKRLLSAGYESIRVGVKGYRLPAIKTYLGIGFVPLIHEKELYKRWERICEQMNWAYEPGEWPKK